MPHGFVNLHFSLLPRWRGAAPVERAILAGDAETGVCIMRIDAGLDTGPVYARASTPIGDDETAGELRARLVELGTACSSTRCRASPTPSPRAAGRRADYAEKLTVEEFRLDLDAPGRRARPRRAGRQPAPGRVDRSSTASG